MPGARERDDLVAPPINEYHHEAHEDHEGQTMYDVSWKGDQAFSKR